MADVKALQNDAEHAQFVEILKAEGVRSYLEIGSKYGGSFKRVAEALPKGSRVVSVDLPWADKDWPKCSASLIATLAELNKVGYDARVVWGNSTDPQVVKQVRKLGPYDCVFLDGNHTLPYIKQDWGNYGPLGTKLVAFHDIAWSRPASFSGYLRIDVPEFWNGLKTGYRHQEIKLEPKAQDNGIGILWK